MPDSRNIIRAQPSAIGQCSRPDEGNAEQMSHRRKTKLRMFMLLMTLMVSTQLIRDSFAAPARNQDSKGTKLENQVEGQFLKGQDCDSCHAVDHAVVGPAYLDIARKYAGRPGSTETIVKSIREGETGARGSVSMPPHRDISDARLRKIVAWILSLKAANSKVGATEPKKYRYTLPDGKTVTLDFPLFMEGDSRRVSKDVFRGYELYNSYCYRCHGQDATESELAPNLRDSLAKGMTVEQMISVCMAGKEEKGMPAWAGFLSEEDAKRIFMYVEGRRLDLVPAGRPPSTDE